MSHQIFIANVINELRILVLVALVMYSAIDILMDEVPVVKNAEQSDILGFSPAGAYAMIPLTFYSAYAITDVLSVLTFKITQIRSLIAVLCIIGVIGSMVYITSTNQHYYIGIPIISTFFAVLRFNDEEAEAHFIAVSPFFSLPLLFVRFGPTLESFEGAEKYFFHKLTREFFLNILGIIFSSLLVTKKIGGNLIICELVLSCLGMISICYTSKVVAIEESDPIYEEKLSIHQRTLNKIGEKKMFFIQILDSIRRLIVCVVSLYLVIFDIYIVFSDPTPIKKTPAPTRPSRYRLPDKPTEPMVGIYLDPVQQMAMALFTFYIAEICLDIQMLKRKIGMELRKLVILISVTLAIVASVLFATKEGLKPDIVFLAPIWMVFFTTVIGAVNEDDHTYGFSASLLFSLPATLCYHDGITIENGEVSIKLFVSFLNDILAILYVGISLYFGRNQVLLFILIVFASLGVLIDFFYLVYYVPQAQKNFKALQIPIKQETAAIPEPKKSLELDIEAQTPFSKETESLPPVQQQQLTIPLSNETVCLPPAQEETIPLAETISTARTILVTVEDVQHWCHENDLREFCEIFQEGEFTGESLREIFHLGIDQASIYLTGLDQNLKPGAILKLMSQLRKLF